MKIVSQLMKRFSKDESGATAIEYGLIAGLIAIALITGAGLVGNNLDEQFRTIANNLNTNPK